jgi:hypothetical protein
VDWPVPPYETARSVPNASKRNDAFRPIAADNLRGGWKVEFRFMLDHSAVRVAYPAFHR